jgi:hypothetical protein
MTSAREVTRFLGAAQQLGIRFGIDGEEAVNVAPLKVPSETLRPIERAIDENRSEFIRDICLKGERVGAVIAAAGKPTEEPVKLPRRGR